MLITGIILAAGASTRMGRAKQPLELGGRPMLERVIDTFLSSSLQEVIVVLSPELGWTPRKRKGLRIVMNERANNGISSSLRAGLASIGVNCDAVVVGLGDKPLLKKSTIEKLIDLGGSSRSEIIVPTYGGKRGNPILFHRSVFPAMRRLKGDVGAKILIEGGKHSVAEVRVADPGVLIDVDTSSDLRRTRGILSRSAEREARK